MTRWLIEPQNIRHCRWTLWAMWYKDLYKTHPSQCIEPYFATSYHSTPPHCLTPYFTTISPHIILSHFFGWENDVIFIPFLSKFLVREWCDFHSLFVKISWVQNFTKTPTLMQSHIFKLDVTGYQYDNTSRYIHVYVCTAVYLEFVFIKIGQCFSVDIVPLKELCISVEINCSHPFQDV